MTRPEPLEPDWESFYRDYRKPGFIEGHEILHKLGGGAFGIVFKARKESIGKNYAIKFLKLDAPGVQDAVLRELAGVSLFAQIDHPNLVTIEDKGEVHGIPYLVMGFAGEETLRSRLDGGRLTRTEALRIFTQVARGVQALHDHSVVHFDLKPGNVFLRGDVARIGDYGLSKLVTASHNSLSFGRGTPYYMAPELLHQRGDARSDIYSLGVILYECLAGDLPFRGDSEWEILRKHERDEPQIPAAIGEPERHVIERCLRKAPAERYPGVRELLDDLGVTGNDMGSSFASVARPPVHETTRASPPQDAGPAVDARTAGGGGHGAPAAAMPGRARRPKRHVHLLVGAALLFLFFVFAGGAVLTIREPAMIAAVDSVGSADLALRPSYAPLPLPVGLDEPMRRRIAEIFRRMRSGPVGSADQRFLESAESRGATLVIGANELLSLDYLSRRDVAACQRIQRVLGSISGYPFRCWTAPASGSISQRAAAENVQTAVRFADLVREQQLVPERYR